MVKRYGSIYFSLKNVWEYIYHGVKPQVQKKINIPQKKKKINMYPACLKWFFSSRLPLYEIERKKKHGTLNMSVSFNRFEYW